MTKLRNFAAVASPRLRPFQEDLERKIYASWDNGAVNVMPVAATGSGKTVVLSKFLLDEPGSSVAIAHRQELVSQISIALARNGVRHRVLGAKKGSNLTRIISALHISEVGHSFLDPNAKTAVGGVDTVIRMNSSEPFFKQVRLAIQDEGHHVLKSNKWGQAAAKFPNARSIFPTATPCRADGKGLGRDADGLVDAMVLAPSMREIINMGYLTDYRIVAPPSNLDLSSVPVSSATGDFSATPLRKAVRESKITGNVVAHYLKFANGKLGVTFAVDVETATELATAFRGAGVPAEVVSAKTPDALRSQILRRFKARKILQLVNVDLFGEGFDLPAIEVVSFVRPTESFALYSQQFGRALRLMLSEAELRGFDLLSDAERRFVIAGSEKPIALIIDHVGNVIRHRLPDAPRTWSLDRRERRGSTASSSIPLRVCVNPECVRPYERIHKCCPYCGAYPPPSSRSSPEFVDGDLTEFSPELLAGLRGEIARIDDAPRFPSGAAPEVISAIRRRHNERQQGQLSLRNSIAWWAGLENHRGLGESESYRKFYHTFGVDVASAQTLNANDSVELMGRINNELAKAGIDGSKDAISYFTNEES